MRADQRARFDAMVQEEIEALPGPVAAVLAGLPVVVEDAPSLELLGMLEREWGEPLEPDELCGLHTGVSITERSVEEGARLPSQVMLFREGIVREAGGWDGPGAGERIGEQIRITLLHEIGHEFGLDEDRLDDLGYG